VQGNRIPGAQVKKNKDGVFVGLLTHYK